MRTNPNNKLTSDHQHHLRCRRTSCSGIWGGCCAFSLVFVWVYPQQHQWISDKSTKTLKFQYLLIHAVYKWYLNSIFSVRLQTIPRESRGSVSNCNSAATKSFSDKINNNVDAALLQQWYVYVYPLQKIWKKRCPKKLIISSTGIYTVYRLVLFFN